MNFLSGNFRLFATSAVVSLLAIFGVLIFVGPAAALTVAILMVIEVTFSFDNAIINAKVLGTMSQFWQRIFMTIGILVAVFGMRIIFPIIIVMASAHLSWGSVVHLALYDQAAYARVLVGAHPSIAAFGGMFLLMLCLHFLFDKTRTLHWISAIEHPLQRIGKVWLPAAICLVTIVVLALLPQNHAAQQTIAAGLIGIVAFLAVHGASALIERYHQRGNSTKGNQAPLLKVGMAGFMAFMYLEVLDASFSLDGVIGAFAITQNVILIAVGLGVGALWVRSLTLFMVRHKLLHAYRYLEHGAYYTIGILAIILLVGLFYDIPQLVIGGLGVGVIALSIVSSRRANALS